ncbi:sulfurtransferase [Pseudomonas sp. N040]|uniref:sulfurtransferase n=1 Tax=Pseudomonas sp. N040 TaxID=2785325 RepID=UPI0018A2A0F4|nr:sulfurtransferase [Pseudomonas sp. N040]MBF7729059.1 sulfurtransferase [Pseudomonas sp. N040]MBW7012699.1 sulfurtransferase [Pseudomonas sp. N040]
MKLPSPAVSTQWLADNLDNPKLRIFDCSLYLTPNPDGPGYITESGVTKWSQAHIPGAGFLDMMGEMLDTSTPAGFAMLPAEKFAQICGEKGIGDDTAVVFYSGQNIMWSARMWWMLRSIGFDNAAVLDGGLEKWEREQRPMTAETRPYPKATLTAKAKPAMWADKADVLMAMRSPAVCTINALQPDIYDGQINRYGRHGHIPGSFNVYYSSLMNPEDGTFLPLEQLKTRFEESAPFGRPTIVYCGGGVSAAIDALALTMLKHNDVAIYDGSMFEWASDPVLPLVLGTEPG